MQSRYSLLLVVAFVFFVFPICIPSDLWIPSPVFAAPIPGVSPALQFAPAATPALPVRLKTPLPLVSTPINSQNVAQIRELAAYGSPYVLAKKSADGKWLVTASGVGVNLYEAKTSRLVRQLPMRIRSNFRENDLRITAQGNFILTINEQNTQVYAVQENKTYNFVTVEGADISPDGALVVLANEQSFQILRTADQQVVYSWNKDLASLHGSHPTFSQNGTYLITWFGNRLWFWEVDGWRYVQDYWLEDAESHITSWAVSLDGTLLAIAQKDMVRVWHTSSRLPIQIINETAINDFVPNQIVFSPNKRLVAILKPEKEIHIWRLSDAALLKKEPTILQNIATVHITDEGNLMTFPLPQGQWITWQGYKVLSEFRFTPRSNGLVVKYHHQSSFSDVRWNEEMCLMLFDDQPSCYRAPILLLSEDLQFYTVNKSGKNISIMREVSGKVEALTSFQISEDYTYLHFISMLKENGLLFYQTWDDDKSAGRFYMLNFATRNMVGQWLGMVRNIAFSANRMYAAFLIQNDATADLVIYNLFGNRTIYRTTFSWCGKWCNVLAFSPDNQFLAFSAGLSPQVVAPMYPLQIIRMERPDVVTPLAQRSWPSALAFTSDGRSLAAALGGGEIVFLDPINGSMQYSWRAYDNDEVIGLAFSANGTLLASLSSRGAVKIWGITP